MVKRFQHARSSVAGAVPDAADVLVGEIIVNFADRTLRTKNGSNALIRVNQNMLVTDVDPLDPQLGDFCLTTDGQIRAYFNPGAGLAWYDVAAPEDLSAYLLKAGGTMSGQITLPGGGAGSQAVTVTEATALAAAAVVPSLLKTGGTMTGHITLIAGATGMQAVSVTQMDAAIAAAIPPDLSGVLLKTGGTMTGQITLPGGGSGNQAISANELSASIAAHAAQPDPHTAYVLTTELNTHIATGGSQHPAATGSVAGFMSAADKTRFDTLVVATAAELLAGTDNAKFLSALALAGLWKKGSSVAGAATITFGDGGYFHITGSGWNCTDFDFTVPFDGRSVRCVADGAGTITHHATTLVCPGGANITVAIGDTWVVTQDATDNVKITDYQRASGQAVVISNTITHIPLPADQTAGNTTLVDLTNFTFSMLASTNYVIHARLKVSWGGNGGFRLGHTGPASPSAILVTGVIAPEVSSDLTGYSDSMTSYTSIAWNSSSAGEAVVDATFYIRNGVNAGTWKMQFAQGNNDSSTTIKENSLMSYQVV